MTTWTQPKTWTSEPLTSNDLNTHLRDNLEVLKDPPSASYLVDESTDYITTSTSWVDVDATNLALTITTNGGDVLVHFHGYYSSSNYAVYLDVDIDGNRFAGNDGIIRGVFASAGVLAFTILVPLAAGSHTFKLQWKATGGTQTLFAGAGTANSDVHPQFWVREVS